MNKQLLERRAYVSPMCKIFVIEPCCQLMETSYPGQHKPGDHGTGPSGAKRTWFEEEEENDETLSSGANYWENY